MDSFQAPHFRLRAADARPVRLPAFPGKCQDGVPIKLVGEIGNSCGFLDCFFLLDDIYPIIGSRYKFDRCLSGGFGLPEPS